MSHGSNLSENYAPTRVTSGWKSTAVSPNADVAAMQTWAARGKIAILPAIMILLPAGRAARNHAG